MAMKMNREQALERNKRLKEVIHLDERLYQACEALRENVEEALSGPDISISKDHFHRKNESDIQSVLIDGLIIGYRIKKSSPLEIDPYFMQTVLLRTPGYRLEELPDKTMAAIQFTIATVFFREQAGAIEPRVIAGDALRWDQKFMVALPVKFQDSTIQVPKDFNS